MSFLVGCRRFFVLCIVSSLLASLFELLCPKIISFTVDTVLGNSGASIPAFLKPVVSYAGGIDGIRSNLHIPALIILILAVLMGLCKYGEAVFNRKGAETLVENMRNLLFGHIGRLPFSWHMKNQTGDIIQRCTSDVETIKTFLSEQLTSILSTLLLIVMSLFFMFSINTTLALIALLSIPVIAGYSAVFHGKIGKGFLECDENEGKLSSIVQENLTGVRVVRAFGREKYEVDKYTKQNDFYAKCWVRLGLFMSLFWCSGDLLSAIQSLTVMAVGTVFCVRGDLTVGDLIAIISYNAMLTWPVRSLGRVISEMSKAGISIGRVGEILDAEEEHDAPDAVDCDPTGDIVFDHVSFSYDGSSEVLHDISMTVRGGSTVGILGMTGSGKSTLAALLTRLYDLGENSGKLTVSGTDIRKIKASSLRKNIGIVLQEPFLFSRTLRENIGITFDDPSVHEDDIKRAAKAACLDETIANFAQGYETVVGERGVTLSGGQKQRTAIARLLTQNTPVMIFDDSLSAVDSETDAKIRKSLCELSGDREKTVILISHRIQTLMSADRIFVMANGRIVEEGTHESLLALGGIYKKISDIQTGISEENDSLIGSEVAL